MKRVKTRGEVKKDQNAPIYIDNLILSLCDELYEMSINSSLLIGLGWKLIEHSTTATLVKIKFPFFLHLLLCEKSTKVNLKRKTWRFIGSETAIVVKSEEGWNQLLAWFIWFDTRYKIWSTKVSVEMCDAMKNP